MKYEKTLNGILSKLKDEVPIVQEGDIIETFKTVYPSCDVPRERKNIVIESVEMTKPLAASKSAKEMMKKDGSSLVNIYKDLNRGDILRVKCIDGNSVKVENISLYEKYEEDFIIDKIDILKKNFIVIQRRSSELNESLKVLGLN